ncbi:MAG: hypothetical protein HQL60_04080 [Magnetococcales bacterium]|nr:hypothetical protein [Magnetococcales bacterium]
MNRPLIQQQSGSLTMVAIIVMAVIAVAGVAVTKGYISGVSSKAQHDEGTVSYNAAQSGAQSILSQLKAKNCDPTQLGGTQTGNDVSVTQILNGQRFTTTFTCVTAVDNKCVSYTASSQAENGRRTTQLSIDCTRYPVDGPVMSKPGGLSIGNGGKVNGKPIDPNCIRPTTTSWSQQGLQWLMAVLDIVSGEAAAATHAAVTLCHKPGTAAQLEMNLTDSNDVSAHLGHGDTMGACLESAAEGSGNDSDSAAGGTGGGDTGGGSTGGGATGGGGTTGGGHTAVAVCHKPGEPAQQQLTIDDDAVGEESVAAHLGHGDRMGYCSGDDNGGGGVGDNCTTSSNAIANCNFVTGDSKLQVNDTTLALLDAFRVSSGNDGDDSVTAGATKTFTSKIGYDTFTLDDNSTLVLNDGVVGQQANFRINLIEQGACITDGSGGSGGGGHVSSGYSGGKGWFGGKGWSGNKGSGGQAWSGGKGRSGGRGGPDGWSSNSGCSGGKGGTAGANWWSSSSTLALQKRGFLWRHDGWGCRLQQGNVQVWRHCGRGTDDRCTSNGSVTIRLAPGDYYVGKISLGANTRIIVNPPGVVRLHVNTLELGTGSQINVSGDVGSLYLMVHDSMKVCDNSQIKAIVLAPGQFTRVEIGDNATLTGAILGGNSVTIGQNIDITYNTAVRDAIKALGGEDDQGIRIISASGWKESSQNQKQ